MHHHAIRCLALAAILCATALRAELAQPDEQLVHIDEGKVYRVVNGEEITGREVADVLVEDAWDKYLQAFIDYEIRKDEVDRAKVTVTEAEVDAELDELLRTKAAMLKTNRAEIEKSFGSGVVEAFKRSIRVDLGLLKVFQGKKLLDEKERMAGKEFARLKRALVERRIQLEGVETDPAKLGTGEAVRIGARSYSRDEVRTFILEAEGQIARKNVLEIVDQIKLEKLIGGYAKTQAIALTDDDRKFHFSYLCRLKEQETGVPGRSIMMQIIQHYGMTPEQYLQCRLFSYDTLATIAVKKDIRFKQIKAEFDAHPDKYKLSESLIAHIFLQVLDPDGHPYGPAWKAEGHPAANAYVESVREDQFLAAKIRIDALLPLAKIDFEETARKHSDDTNKRAGGLIGRMGANTIPSRPLDTDALNAAIKLKPGQISDPVRSAYGWHIFKCLDKQDVTFEEVEERVYLTLIYEARKALIERLLKTAKVEDRF